MCLYVCLFVCWFVRLWFVFGRFVCVFGACVCVFGWVRVCEFCVFVYVVVWFSVSGCVVARLRLNLRKHTQDLGSRASLAAAFSVMLSVRIFCAA